MSWGFFLRSWLLRSVVANGCSMDPRQGLGSKRTAPRDWGAWKPVPWLSNCEQQKSSPCGFCMEHGKRFWEFHVDTSPLLFTEMGSWQGEKRDNNGQAMCPCASSTLNIWYGNEHWRDITQRVALSESLLPWWVFLYMAECFKGRTWVSYPPCFSSSHKILLLFDMVLSTLRWLKQMTQKRGKIHLED